LSRDIDNEASSALYRRGFYPAVLIFVLLAVGVLGVMLWPRSDDESNDFVTLQAGDAAPAFALAGADGQTHTLDQLVARKKVLLYFSMGPG